MMASEIIVSIFGALFSDAAAAHGVRLANAGGASIGAAVQRVLQRRLEQARCIFVEEIREGNLVIDDATDFDEIASCILRYGRAAREGTARLNLRLMASVLSGLAASKPIYASDFLMFSDVLAGLRREEVVLLATVMALPEKERKDGVAVKNHVVEKLVPNVFFSEDDINAYFAAVTRTGLIYHSSGFDGTFYKATLLFDRLASLVNIEGVIEREAGASSESRKD